MEIQGPDLDKHRGEATASDLPVRTTSKISLRMKSQALISNRDLGSEAHLAQHRRPRGMGAATVEFVKAGMRQDPLCALLTDEEIKSVLQTMEHFVFDKDEMVVEQGDVGTTFFVVHEGTLGVSVNGNATNTLTRGNAFGGIALRYKCPRTASVTATETSSCWGSQGSTFHKVLQEHAQREYSENRKFLNCVDLFSGLSMKQKDSLAGFLFMQRFETGARVVTEGEAATAMYFVKSGELRICTGGKVSATGELIGSTSAGVIGLGECFGEGPLLREKPYNCTVLANSACELLCISRKDLKEELGDNLQSCLEMTLFLAGMKRSPGLSQFSTAQQRDIADAMVVREYTAHTQIEGGHPFVVVLEGAVVCAFEGTAAGKANLGRGECYADGTEAELDETGKTDQRSAGSNGCRLGILSNEAFSQALEGLGLAASASSGQVRDYMQKRLVVKKIHVFRHLSQKQTDTLVKAFELRTYKKGDKVVKQGDVGTAFYVIASGEVQVFIGDKLIRNLGKNAYFGERALLFDEPRTATVAVVSSAAEIWSVEKRIFAQIVQGKMQQQLTDRIRLQDTSVTLKDLKSVKLVGSGAAGVVRLVEHKNTGMRYALKRVHKTKGKVPTELARECSLLAENDHPFIMTLVKTFETPKSVYMLTELITGGELHGAIRKIPTVLSLSQSQFYTGSLVLVLEELAGRGIVYRDLKPENVMLDQHGYLKLVDFGIAKKLGEGQCQTFTVIGTPHYMAPDVLQGRGYGIEVDIWSLGVLLFEFVCGHLPFADDRDDPMEVCQAVLKAPLRFPGRYKDQIGRSLMTGLLCRQKKKRLGAGIHGYADIRGHEYFRAGRSDDLLFDKLMGRELDPPVHPTGEWYCNPEDVADIILSDADELG